MIHWGLLTINKHQLGLTSNNHDCLWVTKVMNAFLSWRPVNIEKDVENPPFVDHFPRDSPWVKPISAYPSSEFEEFAMENDP